MRAAANVRHWPGNDSRLRVAKRGFPIQVANGNRIHGGARLRWRKEDGGEAPAPASSPHMLVEVIVILDWLKAFAWNAAILALKNAHLRRINVNLLSH
jgi:hypothetical protein